jgi:hypothetical protein
LHIGVLAQRVEDGIMLAHSLVPERRLEAVGGSAWFGLDSARRTERSFEIEPGFFKAH